MSAEEINDFLQNFWNHLPIEQRKKALEFHKFSKNDVEQYSKLEWDKLPIEYRTEKINETLNALNNIEYYLKTIQQEDQSEVKLKGGKIATKTFILTNYLSRSNKLINLFRDINSQNVKFKFILNEFNNTINEYEKIKLTIHNMIEEFIMTPSREEEIDEYIERMPIDDATKKALLKEFAKGISEGVDKKELALRLVKKYLYDPEAKSLITEAFKKPSQPKIEDTLIKDLRLNAQYMEATLALFNQTKNAFSYIIETFDRIINNK